LAGDYLNMENKTEALYSDAVRQYGRDIARFVAGYERDSPARQELLQEVHLALWQSFSGFAHQCSLRTWVYRVAHNVGVSHIQRSMRRLDLDAASLEDVEAQIDASADMGLTDRRLDLERIMALVHGLAGIDREVMLLYLEDLDAASIAEVTGLSARNVATKVHRIKSLLTSLLAQGRKSA
jgi:RNA polymerase sigma-70 factor, ECF subfamily